MRFSMTLDADSLTERVSEKPTRLAPHTTNNENGAVGAAPLSEQKGLDWRHDEYIGTIV